MRQYRLLVADEAAEQRLASRCLAPPDEPSAVQIVEVDDIFGDKNDTEHTCLTDGAGRISVDLMRGINCPSLLFYP